MFFFCGIEVFIREITSLDYATKLCREVGLQSRSPPPPPPFLHQNQSISFFVIGVVFLLVVLLFLLNLASVVREWVKLSKSVEQRFWGSSYHEGL